MIQPSVVNDEISYLIVEKKQLKDNQQAILNHFRGCKVTQLGSSYGDDENCINPECKDLVKRIPFNRETEYLFLITKDNSTQPMPEQEEDDQQCFESRKPRFKQEYHSLKKVDYIIHPNVKRSKRNFWQILSKVFT